MTQLTKFRGRLADQLSGGMKQKLALACTLVHEPQVIVLDEPTTGVDPVSRREFWKLLSQFLAQGITILMSTPYLDEAERCSRIALLHEGKVLALDQPSRLRAGLTRHAVRGRRAPNRARPSTSSRAQPDIASAQVFGDRLHVWIDRPDRESSGGHPDESRGRRQVWRLPASVPSSRHSKTSSSPGSRHEARNHSCSPSSTCLPPSSFGQSPVRLSLADAIARGFANSHRLAEARAREDGAKAAATTANLADKPIVGASAGYSRTNHVTEFSFPQPERHVAWWCIPTFPTTSRRALSFQWPIYTSGRVDALERAAIAEAQAAGADIETTRADLRLEIVRAYWAAATAREAEQGARGISRTGGAAADRCAAALRCRPDSTERSVEPRSTAIARTRAADRSDQYSRGRHHRAAPLDRRAARHGHRADRSA